jgi:hypothetical protein
MKLLPLTAKQQDILKLLYRYRFLNRIQMQQLMGHKDHKTINVWLKDLRAKQYVVWIYSTDFTEKTKPAIYYLGINGIRFLKTLNSYPIEELRKRYKEADRSEGFILRSMLLAGCCNDLRAKTSQSVRYAFEMQADYINPESGYHFLGELSPQLCFTKQQGIKTTTYLLEIFDTTLPRYRVRTRLKNYVDYLIGGDWQRATGKPLPIVLLVCPRVTDLIYAKRRTKKLLDDEWNTDGVRIRFTTIEQLQQQGVVGEIWEQLKMQLLIYY